jgi:hypothetical protein
MSPELKKLFDKLSPERRVTFFRDFHAETSKAKINTKNRFLENELEIFKRVPITSRLSEAEFIASLDEMHFAAVIVWNTIGRQLDDIGHSVMPPSSVSDTEALPPSPT